MTPEDQADGLLRQLEEELLSPETRHNAVRLRTLLGPDFEEVGASGRVYGREEIVRTLAGETPEEPGTRELSSFHARRIAEDLVLVRYRTRSAASGRGVERASLWRRERDGWTMLYHQGTPSADRG